MSVTIKKTLQNSFYISQETNEILTVSFFERIQSNRKKDVQTFLLSIQNLLSFDNNIVNSNCTFFSSSIIGDENFLSISITEELAVLISTLLTNHLLWYTRNSIIDKKYQYKNLLSENKALTGRSEETIIKTKKKLTNAVLTNMTYNKIYTTNEVSINKRTDFFHHISTFIYVFSEDEFTSENLENSFNRFYSPANIPSFYFNIEDYKFIQNFDRDLVTNTLINVIFLKMPYQGSSHTHPKTKSNSGYLADIRKELKKRDEKFKKTDKNLECVIPSEHSTSYNLVSFESELTEFLLDFKKKNNL